LTRARSLAVLVAPAAALALASGAAGASGSKEHRLVVKPLAERAASATSASVLALQRALSIFAPASVDARFRSAVADVDPRETTLVLRDLVAQKSALGAADRRLAEAILARPSDGTGDRAAGGIAGYDGVPRSKRKRVCTTRFCVHWVKQGSERPSLRDRKPRNGRPDYVDKTIANMKTVWKTEVGALNWKKPLSDRSSGPHHGGNPNGKPDIFIAQIGNKGIYGYCTTDEPRVRRNGNRQVSAYCVIDNNFSRTEFVSGANGNAANKVTLAHEFNHAIQFAYDFFDKPAMMEGTATWMEDEVFNSINDNRQYFSRSPLGPNPWAPLDLFTNSGNFAGWQYGTWIWYRFLSENLGAGANDRPQIVKRIWEKAVGSGRNGFGAIAPALADRGTNVFEQMKKFGEWNSAPRAPNHYREANQGNGYRTAGAATFPGGPDLGPGDGVSVPLEMLKRSNDYFRLDPAGTGPGSTLDFSNVDIPGGAVTDVSAIVFRTGGAIDPPVEVANGASVAFGDAAVIKVIIVFTNAGGSNFFDPNTWDFDATVNP
jgi:hypothetical protein